MTTIIKGVDCPREKQKAGHLIFQEGAESACFYIVKEGEVGIYKDYGKPSQLELARVPAGRVIGEISGIDGHPRSATAVALTDVDLVKVSAKTLQWQLQQSPGWFRAIVQEMAERLRATDELARRHSSLQQVDQ